MCCANDNILSFHFQAGRKVSGLNGGELPIQVGYQPALASELAALEETDSPAPPRGAITSIPALCMFQLNDFTDPAAVHLRSVTSSIPQFCLSRKRASQGFILLI